MLDVDVVEALLDAQDHELHSWAIIENTKRGSPTVYKILERLTAREGADIVGQVGC